MLPIKIELTEKIAATLRRMRLEHPVDGEIMTAENLSKAIGNNRAWMSQIESRRLKKIKREDVIKIYKLLLDEPNEKQAEHIAELDLCSPFNNRYDSESNNSFINDSYSEGIISLDNLMSDLRDVLLDKYTKLESDGDRNALLGCIESMIDNFKNDYEHTHLIYTAPIPYADPEYLGENHADECFHSLYNVYNEYVLSLQEAFNKVDIDSFLENYKQIYNGIMDDLNSIDTNDPFDIVESIFCIQHFSRRFFCYIDRVQNNKLHSTNINIDSIFDLIIKMLNALLSKLKLNRSFSSTAPTFQSSKNELDAIQFEINDIIMLSVKHVTDQRHKFSK